MVTPLHSIPSREGNLTLKKWLTTSEQTQQNKQERKVNQLSERNVSIVASQRFVNKRMQCLVRGEYTEVKDNDLECLSRGDFIVNRNKSAYNLRNRTGNDVVLISRDEVKELLDSFYREKLKDLVDMS